MVYIIPDFTEFLHHNNRLQSRVIVSFSDGQILFITCNRKMMILFPVINLHGTRPWLLHFLNNKWQLDRLKNSDKTLLNFLYTYRLIKCYLDSAIQPQCKLKTSLRLSEIGPASTKCSSMLRKACFSPSKLRFALLYPLSNRKRVNGLKLLGVFVNANFKFDEYVNKMLCLCRQCMYLLKQLKLQGRGIKQLHIVFTALTVSRVLYALPAWGGFLSFDLLNKIDSMLNKAHKFGYTYNRGHQRYWYIARGR